MKLDWKGFCDIFGRTFVQLNKLFKLDFRYLGADTRGIVLAGLKNFQGTGMKVSELTSSDGSAIAVDKYAVESSSTEFTSST